MRFFRFLTLVVSFAFPCAVIAQSSNASLTGFADDPSKAVIPNVSVTAINTETGVKYQTFTNSSGQYVLPVLPPGSYRIEVDKQGFRGIIEAGLVLHVQDVVQMNFHMAVGSSSETVTVDGSGITINTTDGSVGTVVEQQFVANIPLNGRSFQDLISMTPGVVTQSPQTSNQVNGFSGDFSVNGQRTESNYYTVDGVSGNTNPGDGYAALGANNSGGLPAATALGTTQTLISVDALQEFKALSSTYSAEYGRTPGGQFSLVTRSGTSNLHGSLFDYLRNNYFDANDWFNDHYGVPISALRQNDFGGTLGGPVIIPRLYNGKEKSFFFVSYEGLRLDQPTAASIQYVPDTYLRQEAPTALQGMLNAFPVQNGQDYGTSISPSLAEFIQNYSLPSQIDSTSVRLDHTFTPKLHLFFRFGDTPSFVDSRSLSALTQLRSTAYSYTAGITAQLLQNATDEFHLGYVTSAVSRAGQLDNFGGAVPIDFASAMSGADATGAQSVFYLYFPGIGISNILLNTSSNRGRQWNMTDTLSWSVGHHQLKYGVDWLHIETPSIPPPIAVEAIFESTSSVLTNAPNYVGLSKYVPGRPVFNETSAFVQDEWRAAPRVSISAGIRWEVDPAPKGSDGNDAYTLVGSIAEPSTLALAPQGTPLWQTSWFNFAPRLGVAWIADSRPGWETVVRAGGGVFFDTDNEEAAGGFGAVGFFANKSVAGASLPVPASAFAFSSTATPPYSEVYAFPQHLQLPYTLEWSTSLEQSLGKAQTLTISYIGSNGRRLIDNPEYYLASLNPNFESVYLIENGLTSNYQALQTKFQRSVSRGFQALGSYTWSHSLDYGSNDAAIPVTRGNSDFDVRNNFQAGLTWELPGPRNNGPTALFLRNWNVDARLIVRGGFPVTLAGDEETDPGTGNTYYTNVDLVPGQPIYLHGSQYPGGRAMNPAAFTAPSGNTVGNAPRNFVRGFGENQLNGAVQKQFQIFDNLNLQFRAEAFNLLNHPNFGYIDPTLSDAQFGQATQMLNQSLTTMSSLYQQGGPRSMQFALKLSF